METASVALILGQELAPTKATDPPFTTLGKSDPLMVHPLRLPPADIWVQLRTRRLTGMQSADHTDHTEIATVVTT
jgi:hypothetical protein